MQTDAALVGAYRGIELDTVAGVYLHLSVIVHPRNAELDLALGLTEPLKQRQLFVLFLVCRDDGAKRIKHLFDRLQKLRLVGVFLFYLCQHFINIRHNHFPPKSF